MGTAVGMPGRPRFYDFQDVMRHRVMDILFVSTPYDTFILEEAGELSERMVPEDPAQARPAQDPPLHLLRGGGRRLRGLPGGGAGDHLRRRVPPGGPPVSRGGARLRAPRPRRLPRHPDHPALLPPRERGPRAERGRQFSPEGLAAPAPGPAPGDAPRLRLRGLRVPAPRRRGGGAGSGPAGAGAAPAHRPRGVDRLPRRAEPLLSLAEGPHRVRPRPRAAAPAPLRLPDRGRPARAG